MAKPLQLHLSPPHSIVSIFLDASPSTCAPPPPPSLFMMSLTKKKKRKRFQPSSASSGIMKMSDFPGLIYLTNVHWLNYVKMLLSAFAADSILSLSELLMFEKFLKTDIWTKYVRLRPLWVTINSTQKLQSHVSRFILYVCLSLGHCFASSLLSLSLLGGSIHNHYFSGAPPKIGDKDRQEREGWDGLGHGRVDILDRGCWIWSF